MAIGGWSLSGLIFVVWVSGIYVPDPEANSGIPVGVPVLEEFRPKSTAKPPAQRSAMTFTLGGSPSPIATVRRFREKERRYIFRLLIEAEYRAHQEADSHFPTYVDSTMPIDDATLRANLLAHIKLTDKLIQKYNFQVYRQFCLSEKEQQLISKEGLLRHWPPLS